MRDGVQARERTREPHIPASAVPAEARQPASAGAAKNSAWLAEYFRRGVRCPTKEKEIPASRLGRWAVV